MQRDKAWRFVAMESRNCVTDNGTYHAYKTIKMQVIMDESTNQIVVNIILDHPVWELYRL
jgi:hypothetical protein